MKSQHARQKEPSENDAEQQKGEVQTASDVEYPGVGKLVKSVGAHGNSAWVKPAKNQARRCEEDKYASGPAEISREGVFRIVFFQ